MLTERSEIRAKLKENNEKIAYKAFRNEDWGLYYEVADKEPSSVDVILYQIVGIIINKLTGSGKNTK